MNENKNYLTCKRTYFYSITDETIFFEWIKKMSCIKNYESAGDELYLDLVDRPLDYNDVKELIALFYRYKINMKQLAKLLNKENENAFIPWYKKIFGISKKLK